MWITIYFKPYLCTVFKNSFLKVHSVRLQLETYMVSSNGRICMFENNNNNKTMDWLSCGKIGSKQIEN